MGSPGHHGKLSPQPRSRERRSISKLPWVISQGMLGNGICGAKVRTTILGHAGKCSPQGHTPKNTAGGRHLGLGAGEVPQSLMVIPEPHGGKEPNRDSAPRAFTGPRFSCAHPDLPGPVQAPARSQGMLGLVVPGEEFQQVGGESPYSGPKR